MTLYVIGIGGTGAKCVEAIAHLTAVGLLPSNSIEILFVDPDQTNGSLDRTKKTLDIYQKCQSLIQSNQEQCPWMSREIKVNPVWSPFQNQEQQQLKSFFNYNTLKQPELEGLANLFDVLYTKEEGEAELDVGFRGKPAIGSVIMTGLAIAIRTIMSKISSEVGAGEKPKVLLCGSIFGGTGAAGLPTIGRLIEDKLKREGVRSSVQIGGLFVLPYFGFQSNLSQNEVHARSELFLLNTEAALRYYAKRSEQYDAIYLLGNQQLSQVEQFSVGKGTQKNRPHFIELYAALAARHFLLNDLGHGSVITISRKKGPSDDKNGKVDWGDLPDRSEVKPLLVQAGRFAYCWLSDIKPGLAYCQEVGVPQFQKAAPWFTKFFQGKGLFARGRGLPDFNDMKEQEAIKVISAWCQDYLRWLSDIHQCNNEDIELFKANHFKELKKDNFADLVYDDGRDQNFKNQDTVSNLKVKLDEEIEPKTKITAPNEGVVGLAKAIYMLSKI